MKSRSPVIPVLPALPLWVALSLGPAPAQQFCGSACDIRGNPPPASLQDDGGHGSEFKFHHLSDAGGFTNPDGSKIRRYRYSIWNTHPDRVLDAEWPDAGIDFQNIPPGCCATITRESCKKPAEDPKAVIHFGAAKQYSKPASAYLPETTPPAQPPPDHPGHALETKVSGMFRWHNEPLPVDIVFETAATSEGRYSYSVFNKGSRELRFEMRNLTAFWSRRNQLERALASSSWTPSGDAPGVYRLRGEQILRIQASVAGMVERASDLTVFAPDGKSVLARGRVSVWEPAQ